MTKILVVDDDPAILEVIKLILEDSNYEVETYMNGDFVEKLKGQKQPDMILIDVLLSGQDGREITKFLKRNKDTKNIPIIMISAHPSAHEGAMAAGANDFVSKPFDIDDLLSTVNKNLVH